MDIEILTIEIAKLQLEPGDTLIVKIPLSGMRHTEYIGALIKKAFPKQKTLILLKDIDLEVVRE